MRLLCPLEKFVAVIVVSNDVIASLLLNKAPKIETTVVFLIKVSLKKTTTCIE